MNIGSLILLSSEFWFSSCNLSWKLLWKHELLFYHYCHFTILLLLSFYCFIILPSYHFTILPFLPFLPFLSFLPFLPFYHFVIITVFPFYHFHGTYQKYKCFHWKQTLLRGVTRNIRVDENQQSIVCTDEVPFSRSIASLNSPAASCKLSHTRVVPGTCFRRWERLRGVGGGGGGTT